MTPGQVLSPFQAAQRCYRLVEGASAVKFLIVSAPATCSGPIFLRNRVCGLSASMMLNTLTTSLGTTQDQPAVSFAQVLGQHLQDFEKEAGFAFWEKMCGKAAYWNAVSTFTSSPNKEPEPLGMPVKSLTSLQYKEMDEASSRQAYEQLHTRYAGASPEFCDEEAWQGLVDSRASLSKDVVQHLKRFERAPLWKANEARGISSDHLPSHIVSTFNMPFVS